MSLGGEIGEVGEELTPEELDAYINGYKKVLAQLGDGLVGLSKISVQTGTSHGGVVPPDGSIAKVAVDFDTLKVLGDRAHASTARAALCSMAPAPCPTRCSTSSPRCRRWRSIWRPASDLHGPLCFPREPERDDLSLSGRQQRQRAQVRPDRCAVLLQHAKKAIGPFKPELWALPEKAKEDLYQALEDHLSSSIRS